jgi:urease gamma subunit
MTRRLPLLGVLLCCVLTAGCQRTARDLKLNQPTAREACTAFLTAWKEGKKAADLKPKIIGRDHSWDAGEQLVDFELLADEHTDGVTLFLPVKLTLKNAKGKESKTTVTYAVATDPVVTVIRD